MNVNKKLGRFKQWAGERMGGEVKTSVSDDFKSLEVEMGLRQEGSTEHYHSLKWPWADYFKAWSASRDQ